ncbi:unnamed protein product [Echinostoma caproni]|uniref:Intraflagellar transport protein 52 homolog n=1 Tax=Echinostoma caproni TaxID=27848 RepID=A0A183A4D2_9TREM|nr:unnamed protein product [Echinostoma caproni]
MGPTLASSFQASQNTDSLPDTYLDDVIKDFTNIYDTQPELKACKRETGSLPSSLLSLISLVLAILNEEQVPELVQSHDERHIVTGETNYVRSVSRLDQNDAESEPTVPQPPLPGDSGCVACAFAPHNGDTLLTIHRPTKVSISTILFSCVLLHPHQRNNGRNCTL